jgi:ribosomal protein L32E
VKPAWRRARGVTSKIRKEESGWPAKVKVGYGTASLTKGLHPRGLQDQLIHKLSELEGLDPKVHIIRISRRVGERKRLALLEEIRRRNFHVANPGKEEQKPVAAEEPTTEEVAAENRSEASSAPSEAEEHEPEPTDSKSLEESKLDEIG